MIQRGGINCPFANYLFTKVKVNSMCTPAGVSPPCLHSLWFWGLRQGWSQADELGSNPSLFNKAFWDLGFPEPVSRVTRKLFLGSHVQEPWLNLGMGLPFCPRGEWPGELGPQLPLVQDAQPSRVGKVLGPWPIHRGADRKENWPSSRAPKRHQELFLAFLGLPAWF